MSARSAFVLVACVLGGCSDLGSFEHKLTGKQAKAWALCKAAFDNHVYSAPPFGEVDDGHILFAWDRDKAKREGGPLFCRTNGAGTKVIEVSMSTNLSS